MRRATAAMRHGVVHVAVDGGLVASGRSAGQVAGPDEIDQRLRGPVALLGYAVDRLAQGALLGQRRDVAQDLSGDQGVGPQQVPGPLGVAVEGRPLGHHMDDDSRGRGCGSGWCGDRAGGAPAAAAEPVGSGCQGAEGVGAALRQRPRVVVAHRGGQRVESFVEKVGVGGEESSGEVGGTVGGLPDGDVAIAGAFAFPAHRLGVALGDDAVDLAGQAPAGHRRPPCSAFGDAAIHLGHHVLIGDQRGAVDDGLENVHVDRTVGEHLADGGQSLHGLRVVHIAAGFAEADAQYGGHLRAHDRPGVDGPVRGLAAFGAPHLEQFPDRRQPPGGRAVLVAGGRGDLPQRGPRLGRVGGFEVGAQSVIEHTFDSSGAHRQVAGFGATRAGAETARMPRALPTPWPPPRRAGRGGRRTRGRARSRRVCPARCRGPASSRPRRPRRNRRRPA